MREGSLWRERNILFRVPANLLKLTSVPIRDTVRGVIRSFKHRGLKRLYERGDRSKVSAEYLARIKDVLGRLNVADRPDDLDLPRYNFHALKGNYKGFWSVRISGNWRIIFRHADGDAFDIDLVDYH